MATQDGFPGGQASLPKLHHYVPQFLLREFAFGKKRRVHVYDKRTGRVFATNVRNAAAETGFYNVTIGGVAVSVEPALAELESGVAPLVRRILQEERLSWMPAEDRAKLSLFVAVQLTRTRAFRDLLTQAHASLAAVLRDRGVEAPAIHGYDASAEAAAAAQQVGLTLSAHELAPLIGEKPWILLKNPTPLPYYTSDNPVAFQNTREEGPGSLGLSVAGIEIYLPLSKRITLSMICASYVEQMRAARAGAGLLRTLGALPAELNANSQRVGQILRAITSGTALEQRPENVTNQNSLQVNFAARYVYSSVDDFDLVRDMLRDTPELREGGRRPSWK